MIKTLKNLYSKLVKKQPNVKITPLPLEEDKEIVTAYFKLGITDDNNMLTEGDFLDECDDDASKLVFLLCSGALSEMVISMVTERCGKDEERSRLILENAYEMIRKRVDQMEEGNDNDNGCDCDCNCGCDCDDEPVVDPCDVFKQGRDQIEEME